VLSVYLSQKLPSGLAKALVRSLPTSAWRENAVADRRPFEFVQQHLDDIAKREDLLNRQFVKAAAEGDRGGMVVLSKELRFLAMSREALLERIGFWNLGKFPSPSDPDEDPATVAARMGKNVQLAAIARRVLTAIREQQASAEAPKVIEHMSPRQPVDKSHIPLEARSNNHEED
jgi:hypothetical protein